MAAGLPRTQAGCMEISRSFTVQAPIQDTWEVLGTRFHEAGSWASGIAASRKLGELGPAGIAHRQCDIPSLGTITERVDTFDEVNRSFSYSVIEGRPVVANAMGNTWNIEAAGPTHTKISIRIRVELKPVARVLMGWMMKRQMGKLCDEVVDDLRTFIETGRPSPAKQNAVAKAA